MLSVIRASIWCLMDNLLRSILNKYKKTVINRTRLNLFKSRLLRTYFLRNCDSNSKQKRWSKLQLIKTNIFQWVARKSLRKCKNLTNNLLEVSNCLKINMMMPKTVIKMHTNQMRMSISIMAQSLPGCKMILSKKYTSKVLWVIIIKLSI